MIRAKSVSVLRSGRLRLSPSNLARTLVKAEPAESAAVVSESLEEQRAYARSIRGRPVDLIVVPAFLRGIRRSGYVSTATALYELIDNSIEARARSAHVVFGFSRSSAKPDAIAVLDDGHGMKPAMLKVALAWGGTHRENSRHGFGRFGFGLPTACMSQGRRFSVFSKTSDGRLYRMVLDLDELEAHSDIRNRQGVLKSPLPAKLPRWIDEYARKYLPSLVTRDGHCTVVVIEKLDNLSWKTSVALERNLDRAIGVAYRNFLSSVRIRVQGRRVQPIDPLFTTSRARYYDLDRDRAEPVPAPSITVPTPGVTKTIRVRAAYFPPTFARIDKTKEAVALNANERFAVMKENNGLIVSRLGRQVDVLTTGLWTQFQNNDRYWAVEIDFPAELDEWFSVTTNKQRIGLTDPLREALRKGGVPELIERLRARYKRDRQLLSARTVTATTTPAPRTSTAEAPRANGHAPVTSLPGGTFYLVRATGPNVVLNALHPFFGKVYAALADQPKATAALEIILSVLAQSELEAESARKHFYREERRKWSELLETLLSDELPAVR